MPGMSRVPVPEVHSPPEPAACPPDLPQQIRDWARELGFQAVGFANVDVAAAAPGLRAWLAAGFHGEMDYMARHEALRADPTRLLPGTVSVISARMNYLATPIEQARGMLGEGLAGLVDARGGLEIPPAAGGEGGLGAQVGSATAPAYVARYAMGRDYHRVVRGRLATLARRIGDALGPCGARAFTDSAPVLEVELARKAGLGWRGKHTLLLSRDAGSFFFLGEIFVDRILPADRPATGHCGSCTRCIDACPTGAIVAPYRLDARRCISYLTIELKGAIPIEFREQIGNRVYGCDDCQLVCPWNTFARTAVDPDMAVRHGLDRASLLELFAWTSEQFEARLAGSAIRRIGYERWLRNLAVGLGNAAPSRQVQAALQARVDHPSALVREHVRWALERQAARTRAQART